MTAFLNINQDHLVLYGDYLSTCYETYRYNSVLVGEGKCVYKYTYISTNESVYGIIRIAFTCIKI